MMKMAKMVTVIEVTAAVLLYALLRCQGLNLHHSTELIVTANEASSSPAQTHLIAVTGRPYRWINSQNVILDVTRAGFRWEKLAFNYKKRYAVFSEARSRTVNILLMPTNPNITELIQYPILKTGPTNGKRISSIDVDWVSDNIYVSDTKGQIYVLHIRLADEASSSPQVKIGVIYQGTAVPLAIKVHPEKGYLYAIIDDSGATSIQRFDLTTSIPSSKTILSSGFPSALTIDYAAYKLYWLENNADSTCTIKRSSLNGEEVTIISEKIPRCQSESIDFSSGYVLIANSVENSVVLEPISTDVDETRRSISRLSATPHSLVMYDGDRQSPVNSLADDCYSEDCDFCFAANSAPKRCGCQYGYKMAADTPDSCQLDDGALPRTNFAVVTDRVREATSHLYIIDFQKDMSITLPFSLNVTPTDLQVSNDVLYWSQGAEIQRFDLDQGTEANTLWSNGETVSGFAVLDDIIYINSGQTTKLVLPFKNESRHLINHGLYEPTNIAISTLHSILYIGLQLNDELTTPTQSSSLTDRVVQLSLDGKEKVTLVSSQYKLKAMALDDAGDRVYTVQSTREGDLIYYHNILTKEERLLSVLPADSLLVGRLAVARDYLYYYSAAEQQILWKKNKWDGSEKVVVSGRIFDHLEGALFVQGDLPVVWSPCAPNPCEFMCIRIGQTYTCECPDGMVAFGKNCVTQPERYTTGMDGMLPMRETETVKELPQENPPQQNTVNNETIIGATIGACLTAIIIICLLFIFWAWRTNRKFKLQRTISLQSRATTSTGVSSRATLLRGNMRTPSVFSIVNMPLPAIPAEGVYAEPGPPYECVRDMYLHPPVSLKSSLGSSSASSQGLSTCTQEEPIPYSKALAMSEGTLPRRRKDTLLPLPPQPSLPPRPPLPTQPLPRERETLWRQSSIYDSTDTIQEEQYLRPASQDPSQYLEILPTTPTPPHRNTRRKSAGSTRADRLEQAETITAAESVSPKAVQSDPDNS